jgi:hypothetical protein
MCRPLSRKPRGGKPREEEKMKEVRKIGLPHSI